MTTTNQLLNTSQQTIQTAWDAAKAQHLQAWQNRDYAALGEWALAMRDLANDLALAQGQMFSYIQ